MKAGLLLLIVAVVLGGLLGTVVGRDPGYVMLAYGDTALETSLWFAVLVVLLACVALRLVVALFVRLGAGSSRLADGRRHRKARTARAQTVQGLLMLEEGQWQDAHRLLVAAAPRAAAPLINYLNAARAAHQMGDEARRDELLRLAHESAPEGRFAIYLARAKLQLDAKRWEPCLATLLELQSESPRHPQVLDMLVKVYRQVGDMDALIALLPSLRKSKAQNAESVSELERGAWVEKLGDVERDIEHAWQRVPKKLKHDPLVVQAYARAGIEQGHADAVEAALRGCLDKHWSEDLVGLYGRLESDDLGKQLTVMEGWLKQRPSDAAALLAAGRLAMAGDQLPKSRQYLEACLRLQRTPEVYGELGRVCVAQGELERGNEYFSRALSEPAVP